MFFSVNMLSEMTGVGHTLITKALNALQLNSKKWKGGTQIPLVPTGIKSYANPTPIMASLAAKIEELEKDIEHAKTTKRKNELEMELVGVQEKWKKAIVRDALKNKISSDKGGGKQPIEVEDVPMEEAQQLEKVKDITMEEVEDEEMSFSDEGESKVRK